MSRIAPCPACGRGLRLGPEHRGKRLKCPACGQIIASPGGREIDPAAPSGPEGPETAASHAGPSAQPAEEPARAHPPQDVRPIAFAVRVLRDPEGELSGAYAAEFRGQGLVLKRRGKELLIPARGGDAAYRGGNRLEVACGRRDLELAVSASGLYQDRFTRDLVATWNGERPPLDAGDYRVPRLLVVLAWMPILIALGLAVAGGAIGGLIGGVIAALLFSTNLAIIRREAWPVSVRAAAAGSLDLAGFSLVWLVLLGLLWLAKGSGPAGAVSAPPAAVAGRERRGSSTTTMTDLGVFEDPSGDCRLSAAGRSAVIEVPGTLHDLSLLPGRGTNAPRILGDVAGDFQAEVQVEWSGPPADPPAASSAIAFHGVGLLLWSGDSTELLRLERAGFVRGGQVYTYVLFERQGRGGPSEEHDGPGAQGSLRLRLRRNGTLVFGSFSTDGARWQDLPPHPFHAGKARVGVAAVNTTSRPLKATFREFSLTVP